MKKPIDSPKAKASVKPSAKTKSKSAEKTTVAPQPKVASKRSPATPARVAPVVKKSPAKKVLKTKAQPAKAAPKKPAATPAKMLPPAIPSDDESRMQERLRRAVEIVNGHTLNPREKLFVVEYSKDSNGTQSAIKAGYSAKGADVAAIRLLGNARVKLAIDAIMNDRIAQGIYDGDKVIAHWMALSQANQNAVTQYRRVNCRYCWGTDHLYQYTPNEMAAERRQQEYDNAKRIAAKEDPLPFNPGGGLGYRGNGEPNAECPECWGEGIGRPFFTDTRKLSPEDLPLYKGVKEGKEGIEVMTYSQEDARDKLARHYGLYKDKLAEAVAGNYTQAELEARYAASIAKAKERQNQVDGEREVDPNG